jgi:hypothetical protein
VPLAVYFCIAAILSALASAGCAYQGSVRDLEPGSVGAVLVRNWPKETGVSALAFSPDGKQFALARENGTVSLWSTLTSDKSDFTFSATNNAIQRIAYSPDGKFLAWVAQGPEAPAMNPKYVAEICVHSVESGRTIKTKQDGGFPYDASLAFSNDSKRLWAFIVNPLADSTLMALDSETLKVSWRQREARSWLHHFYRDSNSLRLAAFGQLLDLTDGAPTTLSALRYPPDALSSDGRTAFFSWPPNYVHWFGEKSPGFYWRDGGIEVGDVMRKHPKTFLRFARIPAAYLEEAQFVQSCPAAPEGWLLGQLRTLNDDGDLPMLINIKTGRYQSLCPPGVLKAVGIIAASDDGRMVAVAGTWGVLIWDIAAGI